MNGTHGATPGTRPDLRMRYRWLVPGILLAILVFLLVNVLAHGPVDGLDHRIGHAIQSVASRRSLRWVRHGHYTPARVIIDFGGLEVALALLGVAAVVAAIRQRGPRPLVAAAVGAVGALGCIYVAKKLIRQPTPRAHHLLAGHGHSFPSGHMTLACVCYFLIAVLLFPGGPDGSRRAVTGRRLALAGAAVLCTLIGASLLWCDLHWFSDVVAGAVLAALLVMVAAWVARPPAGPGRMPGAAGAVGAAGPAESSTLDQAGR